MKRFFVLLSAFLIQLNFMAAAEMNEEQGQSGSYEMSLSNGRQVNKSTFEFDVLIKGAGKGFILENYQCAFGLGRNLPANSLHFSYINNSSEVTNTPGVSSAVVDEDGRTVLVFASNPEGCDTIGDRQVKLGRFRVRCINQNGDSLFNISWKFKGTIGTIISNSSKNVTRPESHIDLNGNPSAESKESLMPKVYALSQNFPNPFNPTTSINFSLPFESKIKISVFNSLGELVSDLLDKVEPAGNHSVKWNASSMASGIYIYTIEAEPIKGGSTFKSIKKMMLLK